MRIGWRHLLFAVLGLLAAAVLVAWSGVFNVAASSGHWRITEWALHAVMQNSVRTYAHLAPDPPADLDDPRNVLQAAGHYESGCAWCHGSPLRPPPAASRHMTPPPPAIINSARQWEPRELFRIVRHGIKYTAMPAWIAPGRDDEVWAMVAFLRALPEMTPANYGDLAFGTETAAATDDRLLSACARCHGRDGRGRNSAFPILGGQREAYLIETLRAFATHRRRSGVMELAVDGVGEDELARLARHYAQQKGLGETPTEASSPGARIAALGLPEAGVPACESCHGAVAGRNPTYPRLAGQEARYIAAQLRLMKQGERGGTPYAHIMHAIAKRLPDDAIEALAAYYASAAAPSAAGPVGIDGSGR
jgi:cytochrome c553